MSTEKNQRDKDWEAATEFAVNANAQKDLECFTPETCLQIGFRKGIQHARQGERAKLIKFITWVRNHYAVNAVIDNKGMVDFYLEQESKI